MHACAVQRASAPTPHVTRNPPLPQVVLARVLRVTSQHVHVDPGFHSITDVPRTQLDVGHVHQPAEGQVGCAPCTCASVHPLAHTHAHAYSSSASAGLYTSTDGHLPARLLPHMHYLLHLLHLFMCANTHARSHWRIAHPRLTFAWATWSPCAWTRCTRHTATCRCVWLAPASPASSCIFLHTRYEVQGRWAAPRGAPPPAGHLAPPCSLTHTWRNSWLSGGQARGGGVR